MKNIENFSRRKFLNYTMVGGLMMPLLTIILSSNDAYGVVFQTPKDLENLTELERIHLPKI